MLAELLRDTNFPIIGVPAFLSRGNLVSVEFNGDQTPDNLSALDLTFGAHFDAALWVGLRAKHDARLCSNGASFLLRLGADMSSPADRRTEVVLVNEQTVNVDFTVYGRIAAGWAQVMFEDKPYTISIGSRHWGIGDLKLERLSALDIAAIETFERTATQAREAGFSRFGLPRT